MLKNGTFNVTIIKDGKNINTISQADKQIVYQGQEINVKM